MWRLGLDLDCGLGTFSGTLEEKMKCLRVKVEGTVASSDGMAHDAAIVGLLRGGAVEAGAW